MYFFNIPKSIHSLYKYFHLGKAFISPTTKTRPNRFSLHHVTVEKDLCLIMSLSNSNSLDVYNVNTVVLLSNPAVF